MGRVVEPKKLESTLKKFREGKKIVFTNGCFDLLHVGHIKYLQEARSLGDALVVGLNTDSSVRKIKGPQRPIQNQEDRAEILAALGCVDLVTWFDEDTPEQLIQTVKPDVLVKGGDWKIETIVGAKFVQSYGGKVQSLSFVQGRSTSALIQKITTL